MDTPVDAKASDVTTGTIMTLRVELALWLLYEAVIVALPTAAPVASPGVACPDDCTVAVAVLEEVHAAELVTFLLDPSL